MLRIGICEDETATVEHLHNLLVKILFSYTEMEFQFFADGEEVIEAIRKEHFDIDLLFLDIHMERMDGMKTAAFIRKHNIDVDIIFLTVSEKYVYEGYNYRAFAYCLKPPNEEKLAEDLARYMAEREKCSEYLNVSIRGKEKRLPLNKIIYFESEKRKIIAHTLTEEMVFYSKLDEIEEMVGEKGFVRCHQSYMVNRSMIDSIGRTELLVQGIHIPVSRKYYEGLGEESEETSVVRVTHSLAINQEKAGAIVFVKGKLIGTFMRINSGKEVRIGRDAIQVDIVVHDTAISRLHCGITYNGKKGIYTVKDYSKNGLYRGDGKRLQKEMAVELHTGDELWLGSDENIICLG